MACSFSKNSNSTASLRVKQLQPSFQRFSQMELTLSKKTTKVDKNERKLVKLTYSARTVKTNLFPNIMKKSKYQKYFHCFFICILGPYAFWVSFQQNRVTILVNTIYRDVVLIRGRRLFEAQRLLEEIRYTYLYKKVKSLYPKALQNV